MVTVWFWLPQRGSDTRPAPAVKTAAPGTKPRVQVWQMMCRDYLHPLSWGTGYLEPRIKGPGSPTGLHVRLFIRLSKFAGTSLTSRCEFVFSLYFLRLLSAFKDKKLCVINLSSCHGKKHFDGVWSLTLIYITNIDLKLFWSIPSK